MNVSSPSLTPASRLGVLSSFDSSKFMLGLQTSLHRDTAVSSQLTPYLQSSNSFCESLLTASPVTDMLYPSILSSSNVEQCQQQQKTIGHANHKTLASLISSQTLNFERGLLQNGTQNLMNLHEDGTSTLSNDVPLLHHCHPSLHSSNSVNIVNGLLGCSKKQFQHHCSKEKYAMDPCSSFSNNSCEDTRITGSCEQFCATSSTDAPNGAEDDSPSHNFSGGPSTSDVELSLSHNINVSHLQRSDVSEIHQQRHSPSPSHLDLQSLSASESVIADDGNHSSDVSSLVRPYHTDGSSHHHSHHHRHHHMRNHLGQDCNEQEGLPDACGLSNGMSNLMLRHCHSHGGASGINGSKHQTVGMEQHVPSSSSNFAIKNEIDHEMLQCIASSSSSNMNSKLVVSQKHSGESACNSASIPAITQHRSSGAANQALNSSIQRDTSNVVLQQHLAQHSNVNNPPQNSLHQNIPQHLQHMSTAASISHHQLMNQHAGVHHSHHLEQQRQQQIFAAAAVASGGDPRHHHLHYGNALVPSGNGIPPADCLTTQKAVAFLAGPRERIHVIGNPVDQCPRCLQEGNTRSSWRPHRHIGELKIRYICTRLKNDLESNHHIDIPLCPVCNQVLYLFEFNSMLGVSNARRLHKYVLKCAGRHVLPLLDLFCQTKKGGERCNANFKLQWCYGTMVKRCEAQKNRDHDLWWVRYKNEWKQRRTIIRYKKDFLSHLTDAQRSLLLGLGLEGEPPPDPKSTLGPTFDALVSSLNGGSLNGPKIKKRAIERGPDCLGGAAMLGVLDTYDILMNSVTKRQYRGPEANQNRIEYSTGSHAGNSLTDYRNPHSQQTTSQSLHHHLHPHHHLGNFPNGVKENTGANQAEMHHDDSGNENSLRHVMGAVVLPSSTRTPEAANSQLLLYLSQQQQQQQDSSNRPQSVTNSNIEHDYAPENQQSFQSVISGASSFLPAGNNLTDNLRNHGQGTNVGLGGSSGSSESCNLHSIPSNTIITGTPTPPLPVVINGRSPVAIAVMGEPLSSAVITGL